MEALFIVIGLEVYLELISWGYSSLFGIADKVSFDQWCNVIVSVKSLVLWCRRHKAGGSMVSLQQIFVVGSDCTLLAFFPL